MTQVWKRIEPTTVQKVGFRTDNAKHDRMTDALAVLLGYDQLMQLRGEA